ncbi:YceI family protein [Marinobacter sp.]|uniref:YceI family protein n=1 Tax=Marinobacter sp. TaxID=50741 RepID=UPI00356AFF12
MKTQRNAITHIAAGVAVTSLALAATSAQAEPKEYKIDEEHLSITFEVNHLGYASVIGLFLEGKGQFEYDEETNEVPSGKVVIQSASVFSNHDKRDEHLRKDDFLHSDRYPEITFEVTDFETTGERTGNLTGDLTLLGQTRPVTLDVTLNKAADYPIGHKEYTLGISASTTIKRSEWGMTYALDPLMVADDVHLRFEFEAIQDEGWF